MGCKERSEDEVGFGLSCKSQRSLVVSHRLEKRRKCDEKK